MATEALGARIRAFRAKKRWSLRHLGHVIGVGHVSIYRWESGEVAPSYARIEQLAQAFGIAPSTLIPPQKKIKSLSNGHAKEKALD